MSFSAKWVWVQPRLPSLPPAAPKLWDTRPSLGHPGEEARKSSGQGGWSERAEAQGRGRRRAAVPGAVPLLPPSQLRPLLRAARPRARKADSPRTAPCPHLPPLASSPKSRSRVARAMGTGRRAQVRNERSEKEFRVGPRPGWPALARGAEELCPGRGEVTQVALPGPRTPLPLSPPGYGFPPARPMAKRGTTPCARCCCFFSAPALRLPCALRAAQVQTSGPHPPHLRAPGPGETVHAASPAGFPPPAPPL